MTDNITLLQNLVVSKTQVTVLHRNVWWVHFKLWKLFSGDWTATSRLEYTFIFITEFINRERYLWAIFVIFVLDLNCYIHITVDYYEFWSWAIFLKKICAFFNSRLFKKFSNLKIVIAKCYSHNRNRALIFRKATKTVPKT